MAIYRLFSNFLSKRCISNPLDVSISSHTLTLLKSSRASSHLPFHLCTDSFLSSAFRIKMPLLFFPFKHLKMHLKHVGSRKKGDRKMPWENKRDNILVFETDFT